MRNKNKVIVVISFCIIFFVLDRYFWMPERAKHSWRWESGLLLGDPICYKQDFEIYKSKIKFLKFIAIDGFKNINRLEEKKYYLAGCYFGRLYIYDSIKNKMTIYTEN